MIPRSSIDTYTKGINAISEQARANLANVLSQIDYTQDGWVDLVLDAMQTVCGASTDMTSVLAAEYYDYVREYETGERLGALADSGRKPVATEKATRGIVQKGVDGDVESMNQALLDRVDYEVKKAAADAMFLNGARDKLKPRFARVTSGSETCKFCLMLSSRGFVYTSASAAGETNHYHANCDCRIVPGFGKNPKVAGYDPDQIYKEWKKAEKGS